MSKVKAISLFSGGLDSVLSTVIISKQGIEVTAVKFLTPFGCNIDDSSCGFDASHLAARFGFSFKVCPLGEEYVKMVRSPRYGWGKNMNPCIDCRIMMLQWAADIMQDVGAEFVITGEVLNQRPMSQTAEKLKQIEVQTGLEGRLLRPLSARLLPPTIAEQNGLVDRESLYAIQGRSRKHQLMLANQFGLTEDDHGQPSGGCLLTDPSYSNRLRDFWAHSNSTSVRDMEILKVGRHFRYSSDTKIIIGRNDTENQLLRRLASDEEAVIEFDVPSPTVIIQGHINDEIKTAAVKLGLEYTKHHATSYTFKHSGTATTEPVSSLDRSVDVIHIT